MYNQIYVTIIIYVTIKFITFLWTVFYYFFVGRIQFEIYFFLKRKFFLEIQFLIFLLYIRATITYFHTGNIFRMTDVMSLRTLLSIKKDSYSCDVIQ